MNTKLTLSINKKIIEKAKHYALRKKTSLSKLIENHLARLVGNDGNDEISPLVKSISGVATEKAATAIRKGYSSLLKKKYK